MNKSNDIEKLASLPYNKFIKELKQLCKHHGVRKLIRNSDEMGEINKEDIKISEKNLPVKDLKPTECEIGISDYFKSSRKRINNIIKGDTSFLNKNRILVALLDEKYYIIDGHHRWCMIYLFNPKADIPSTVLEIFLPFFDER